MGKIAKYKFLTFFVVSFDLFNEPPHVHITKEKGNFTNPAKLWLSTLEWADMGDLNEKDSKLAFRIVKENQTKLLDLFNQMKAGNKVKSIVLS